MDYLFALIKDEQDAELVAKLKATKLPPLLKDKLDHLRYRTAAHIVPTYWKNPSTGEIRIYFNAFSGKHRHNIKNNFIII